jgi:hypothetical protein
MRPLLYLFLWIVAGLLTFVALALSQDRGWRLYRNSNLGIEFRYRNLDDSDKRKTITTPQYNWKETAIPRLKFSIKLPTGYKIKTEHANLASYITSCANSPIGDSMLVVVPKSTKRNANTGAIVIYFTCSSFRDIASGEGFSLLDSTDQIVSTAYAVDSANATWALAHNSWTLEGRSGFHDRAAYLDGKHWKGLRGATTTGYHDESGYAGLQNFYASFLVCNISANCNMVCSYHDTQMEANALRESDFYDIVATIQFNPPPSR